MTNIDGAFNGLVRLAIMGVVIGAGAIAVVAVLDRLALDQRAAERRALLQRNAELNVSTLAPGSVLSCIDGGAGEAIESACEKAVFASPETAAGAVAYIGARLALLADAHAFAQTGESTIADVFAPARRAVELDRYGIVAHVLATRDGCTAERCAAFALLRDTAALKANLRAQAFDTYVARYAEVWNKPQAVAVKTPQAPAPAAGTPEPAPSGQPVSSKYDFPSAASIPPVSIMNAEPAQSKSDQSKSDQSKGEGEPAVPVPLRRPQAQAATPPAR